MFKPKLRNGNPNKRYELYPINEIPNEIVYENVQQKHLSLVKKDTRQK